MSVSSQRRRRPRPLTNRTGFLSDNEKHPSNAGGGGGGGGRGRTGREQEKAQKPGRPKGLGREREQISAEGEGGTGGRGGRREGEEKGGEGGRRGGRGGGKEGEEGREGRRGRGRRWREGGKHPRTQRALHSPVLYTCSSSTIPSLPPPNTTMSSLMATARWPWRGRGTGPDQPTTRFQRGCRSTAGELAGDTAEAIVTGKAAVGKKSPSGKGAPQFLSHTPPFV